MLALTRAIGVLIIAVLVTWLLFAVLRGRLHPVGGLGVALGATVLLFPVVQPWYLLWAIIPLAAWATRPRFRTAAIVVTLVVGHFRAHRQRRPVRVVPDPATRPLASTVIVALLIALTYYRLPWRSCRTPARAATTRPSQSQYPEPRRARRRRLTPTLSPRDLRLRRPRATARGLQTVRVDDRGRPVSTSTCNRAEVFALLGPNGAGKTTTVEMCEGFVRPDAGTIEILGLNPVTDNARVARTHRRDAAGRRRYPAARPARCSTSSPSYAANPLDPHWLMDTLGLTDAASTTYRRLSGGQQQRLALACAVVGRPELVFLDEPTAGMDAHARMVVWELIDALRRDGVTVVLTTHQLNEAEELADRLVIIDHGVAVAAGTPAELMRSGAENQLRFSAPRMLDLSLLVSALPEGYKADRDVAGRIPRRGTHRSAGAGDRDGVVRAAERAGHRHARRAAQPRGRVPRSDGAGVAVSDRIAFAAGTFTPDPRPATVPRMLAAQFGLELKLLLRNGEQLLLTMFIPITLLVGLTLLPLGSFGDNRAATFVPAIMALAVISTAFTGQAIAVAFDRRYGALKRLGATALPVWGIIAGKSLAVVTVVFLQSILLGAIGFALGWRPHDRRAGCWAR